MLQYQNGVIQLHRITSDFFVHKGANRRTERTTVFSIRPITCSLVFCYVPESITKMCVSVVVLMYVSLSAYVLALQGLCSHPATFAAWKKPGVSHTTDFLASNSKEQKSLPTGSYRQTVGLQCFTGHRLIGRQPLTVKKIANNINKNQKKSCFCFADPERRKTVPFLQWNVLIIDFTDH